MIFRALPLITGDALEILRTAPASTVDMCMTSPPYRGRRDTTLMASIRIDVFGPHRASNWTCSGSAPVT